MSTDINSTCCLTLLLKKTSEDDFILVYMVGERVYDLFLRLPCMVGEDGTPATSSEIYDTYNSVRT